MSTHRLTLATWKQRLDLVYAQAMAPLLHSLLAMLLLYATLRFFGHHPLLDLWLGLSLLSIGLRFLFLRAHRLRRARLSYRGWYRLLLLGTGLGGVAWGCVGLYPLDALPAPLRSLPFITVSLVMVAALPSYIPMASAYASFAVGLSLSFTLTTWFSHSANQAALLVLAVLLPVLLSMARRFERHFTESLALQRRERHLLERMRANNARLSALNEVLNQKQDQLDREEAIAQHVFCQLTGDNQSLEHCRSWTRPMGSFSGDLIQMASAPNGDDYILLGDFTGHGLPAAMGAVPASSVFLAMAGKGLPLASIAAELNRKLHSLLPTGYFCCAVLLRISADRRHAHIHNAGLPPVLVATREGVLKHSVESEFLPLGVVAEEPSGKDGETLCVTLAPGDCVYAYSDGLTEAEESGGAMWGQQRMESLIQSPLTKDTGRLEQLRTQVLQFIGEAPPSDDIAVVEYCVARVARRADAA